jgi:type III restriction enzyme
MTDIDVWNPINLIYWLDRNVKQEDIPQPQMVEWIRKIVEHLTEVRKISLSNLMIAKFALLNKLLSLITLARSKARTASFELFESDDCRKKLDFDNGFEFKKGMYIGAVPYRGKYKFNKHFLSIIPAFDGGESGEECKCAQAIDAEPEVKYWIRNISRHPDSFRLPTSTDNFYPDFVARLQDGRTLVIEYKGKHLVDNQDTKEKETSGRMWEKQSGGKNLFLLAVKDKDGKSVAQQIKDIIHDPN